MATRGIYVQRLSTGEIHNVQVEDDTGLSRTMNPRDYVDRGYTPSIESLPDVEKYTQVNGGGPGNPVTGNGPGIGQPGHGGPGNPVTGNGPGVH